jgi:hypothetical protein
MRNGAMSFKDKREFLEIAKAAKNFDEVVSRTGRAPAAVRKLALKLGVRFGNQIATDTQLLAARDRERKQHSIAAGKKSPAG